MKLSLRSIVFSLVVTSALFIPQVSSADGCFSFGFGVGDGGSGASVGVSSGDCVPGMAGYIAPNQGMFGLPAGSILNIVFWFVDWLLTLLGILGIFGFVISGVMYLLSAGDSDLADRAKDGIKYSIIGIAVGLSGYVIMQAIWGLLQGTGGDF